jgi:hypothetical protein
VEQPGTEAARDLVLDALRCDQPAQREAVTASAPGRRLIAAVDRELDALADIIVADWLEQREATAR